MITEISTDRLETVQRLEYGGTHSDLARDL